MDKETRILKIVAKRGLNPGELERVLKSVENASPKQVQSFRDYYEQETKIGIFSDCHIGAKEFDEPFFRHMVKTFKREKVSRIYNVGDTLEGMSGRPGHIYDLSEIGFAQQFNKALRLFKLFGDIPVFGIDGNHDQWYQKKTNQGVIVGAELQRALVNYHFLGQNEANVQLRKNVTMKLIHPNDGTAYAISYKMQKRAESLTGGEKPEILIQGHYHKTAQYFMRNIHCIDAGTICGQTPWMRGRNIPAHKGFWIIDIKMGRGGIGAFKPTLYPGYK